MFKTLFIVTKMRTPEHDWDKAIYSAYFMDEKKALAFAKSEAHKEAKKRNDFCDYDATYHYDGSFDKSWYGMDYEVSVSNEAWIEDRSWTNDDDETVKGIVLQPCAMKFETMEQLEKFCIESQNTALR